MGFAGALPRSTTFSVLERAIRAVAEGELWAPRKSVAATIRELLADQSPRKLTSREEQIFSLIAGGYKNREVAEKLFISRETVRWHLRSINSKLGIQERGNFIKYATIPVKPPTRSEQTRNQRRTG